MSLTDLEPKLLWKHFDEIRTIPRCSGHEEKAREYVERFAREHGFDTEHDDTGNVVVKVPASPGLENAPVIILQGHLDMVCEKNSDVEHDFAKDPIQVEVDGEWVTAKGTTLGADNGVGLAAALAAAEDTDLKHGPLELLFTVDEETGLTGARDLAKGMLNGKILLNLDSEELGAVFIGCSGGGDSNTTFPVGWTEVPKDAKPVRISVSGLRGGHSGLDIREQRGNAIKILTRVLWEAGSKFNLSLATIDGGNKRNAIPREAGAEIFLGEGQVEDFKRHIGDLETNLEIELGGTETDLTIRVEDLPESPSRVMTASAQNNLLGLLTALPHGVVTMSYDIPDLVETSTNLATVKTLDDSIAIGGATRSSVMSALQTVRDRIRAAGELVGATVDENEPYPGWKPNLNSEVLRVFRDVHKRVLGKEPEVKAIHAGLECGIIGEKYPGTDMISFGPWIEHPHSPDERMNIPSVMTFWTLLRALLETMASPRAA
jgi:dipeptidase D